MLALRCCRSVLLLLVLCRCVCLRAGARPEASEPVELELKTAELPDVGAEN